MILAIDIGNTNICIGGLEGDRIRFAFRMVTRPHCTPDEYTAELRFLLRRFQFEKAACTGAILCSVVPALSGPLAEAVPPAGGGLALVIGNEGAGLSPEAVAAAGMAVRIPMTGAVESLNAAVAGSILLWHFRGVGL